MMPLFLHSQSGEDLHISLIPQHSVSVLLFLTTHCGFSVASKKEVVFHEGGSRIQLSITECSNMHSLDAALYLEAFYSLSVHD